MQRVMLHCGVVQSTRHPVCGLGGEVLSVRGRALQPPKSSETTEDLRLQHTSLHINHCHIAAAGMKKKSIRYLRAATKSENGMKKMGRSKPRKGPDDLVEMPVEKITTMRSMTTSGDSKRKNRVLEEEDEGTEDGEFEMDDGEKPRTERKVGVIGKYVNRCCMLRIFCMA